MEDQFNFTLPDVFSFQKAQRFINVSNTFDSRCRRSSADLRELWVKTSTQNTHCGRIPRLTSFEVNPKFNLSLLANAYFRSAMMTKHCTS